MRMKRLPMILCAALLALALVSCAGDAPPDDGSPAPAPLCGTFVCGGSSLSFDGDGQSVLLNVTHELSEKAGLPAGESEGTYVFLFHNEAWRYDKAEYLRVTVGSESYELQSDFTRTCEDVVALYLSADDAEPTLFIKEQ